ncbi:uncharacterized protein LOC124120813 [Haliotis rufescens]|uniref:uncharacterized protein LOC124120813 n=1 Tax=Haliotis rufescens TaxID=6454 RepID=UPI00201F3ACB|nr:uncharacterized protein LOC124120813 [Haliotis rufescens]
MMTKILNGELTFTSLKPLDLSTCSKEEIKLYFENSYDLNESLFTALKEESVFYKCPDRLRLPLIFYFAHTATVYVNKLLLASFIKSRVNFEFETMFETGVDEMSWDDTENYRMGGGFEWPSLDQVVKYRQRVRNLILDQIDDTPLTLPITAESSWWGLVMGMEHERIHLETSSVLIRQLPIHLVSKPEGWTYGPVKSGSSATENSLISVETHDITIGKPKNFPSYGWDNEYGQAEIHVPPFKASKYLVTNGEFLGFVRSGGYRCKKYWSSEGWKWREFKQANHPVFWVCNKGCVGGCGGDLANWSHCHIKDVSEKILKKDDNNSQSVDTEYRLRLMFDLVNLPIDWPAEVNYHEAKAFCCWKGAGFRLPTEAEHNVMRGKQRPISDGTACDIIYSDKIEANLNLQYGSSTPVNLYPSNEMGFHDAFGNVWTWLEDHFNGLCGFSTHWLYDDFSSPCFDGHHNMILGGSWISTGDEASRFARFGFRRHFFQHLGFRLVQTIDQPKEGRVSLPARVVNTPVFVLGKGVTANSGCLSDMYRVEAVPTTNLNYCYEGENSLVGILELEFGFRDSGIAVLAAMCGEYTRDMNITTDTALHLGAGTGRGAFELSKVFYRVLGLEPVGRYVDASLRLKEERNLKFSAPNNNSASEINLGDYDANPERITFKQLTWISNEVDSHDLVLVTHLDRVQNPKAWLMRVWEITKPNGIAVVGSLSGEWTQEKMQPMLGERMTCVLGEDAEYSCPSGRRTAVVTVWRRQ